MNRIGKFIVLAVLMFILQPMTASTATAATQYTAEADWLNDLGLFNGTSKGYELDRAPKRIEAAAMLVRLLGAEAEATKMQYTHPFTDVPAWADSIVGYI